ncbi:MAG: TPR Domain containing protein [Parcubacteria group bacterium GW2011_GWE2_40_8]|nr:MAG: TPR Domain containing protein [Parcubacteria group bacterium GW2011_GWE2_40_8]
MDFFNISIFYSRYGSFFRFRRQFLQKLLVKLREDGGSYHILAPICLFYGFNRLLQLFGRLKTHQGDRLDASLGNASYMAIYMAFGLFTALLFFVRSKNKRSSIWIYAPIIALQTIVLYYTATRGAILGVIGGLFLASVLIAIFAERKKVKMAAGGFALAVMILIGGFLAIKNTSFVTSSPVLNRFSGISLKERTTESRLTIWKMSWEGFMEKPVLGWGPENFNLVFNKYYEPSLYRQEPWFDRAHNVFFDRLVTGGVIGLVSYLGLFFFAVYYLWSRRNKTRFSVYDSAILTAMFAAYFTHNLFVFDNLISLILFFTFLAYIHYRRVEGPSVVVHSPESKILSADDVYKKMYMVAGITGLAIFSIYYLNIPGIMASKNIIYAMRASSAGDAEGSFRKFQKAISHNSFGSLEAREHMTSFVLSTKDSPSVKPEIRSEMISYTVDELKKQNEEYPNDIRELLFLGMFYNKTGMYDEAEKTLKEAMALSPDKQQIYFELGGLYISRNDYVNGLQILKTAFELDETFGEARTIYAVASIFAGNEKLAEELMADYGGTVKADERFLKAYASKNNFTKVVSILNLFIEKEPNNIQHRLRLAAAYLQANQRQLAIAEIEKSIEINPSFKEQGEYYVNEIKAGRNP